MLKLKTYLVEDSQLIRENLSAALEELASVTVVGAAADEAGAIAWLNQHAQDCDLVLIDLFLKQGSGMGVLAAVNGLPGKAKYVILSNYATPYMRKQALDLGADQVFDKSRDITTLIDYCIELAGGGAGGSLDGFE